jgi:hypothetical protein
LGEKLTNYLTIVEIQAVFWFKTSLVFAVKKRSQVTACCIAEACGSHFQDA